MRVLSALGAVALAAGCDLGIDESQIGATSDGGAPPTSSSGSTGPASSASSSGTSTSAGPASTASATATTTTTVASTSTGSALPQVACFDSLFGLVDCPPGEVCCVAPAGSFGYCGNTCLGSESKFECDGPEDCPPGQECCAPDEEDGDVTCVASCADDDTVCKGDGDCVDSCSEEFSGPLGRAYQTCF